ncbi:MAG: hypothetical protein AB8G99_25875 [Planctomycetaceae bacterium]
MSIKGLNAEVSSTADLIDLVHLSALDELVIKGEILDDDMLSNLPPLAELKTLTILPNDSFTGRNIAHLAACPKLTTLEIIFSDGLQGDYLAQLSQVPSLRRLVVIRGPITDSTLKHIGNLSQLTSLELGDWGNSDNIKCESVKPLIVLRDSLRELRLHGFSHESVQELRAAMPDSKVNWIEQMQ